MLEKERLNRKRKELAERLFNLLEPWEKADTSIQETEECLKDDPLAAVEWLLDMVEAERG